jgi:hypothetical protein
MKLELERLHRAHLEPLGASAARWGWKQPRSTLLLPFLDRVLPNLRFMHLIRDGRDMAYSANRTVTELHGAAHRVEPAPARPRRGARLGPRSTVPARPRCRGSATAGAP